jgi:hypothetical protein
LGWQPASSAAGSIRFAAKVIYKSISSWLNSSITCGQIFLVFHIQTNGREIELITFVTKPRKRWRHRDRERELCRKSCRDWTRGLKDRKSDREKERSGGCSVGIHDEGSILETEIEIHARSQCIIFISQREVYLDAAKYRYIEWRTTFDRYSKENAG